MPSVKRTLAARIENLDQATSLAEECAGGAGLDQKRLFGFLVAVEEAFVNICTYAYPDSEGEVHLQCACKEGCLAFELIDSGIAFNMLSLPDPDTAASIEERKIGGLGSFFIRKLTDEVSYQRAAGRNILRMVLYLDDGEAK